MRKETQTPLGRFFGSRWFLVSALVAIALVAFGYARAYYQEYKIREEIATLEGQVRTLEKKRLESMEILEYVTSNAFVEEKARTELNLKKPGERVVVVEGHEQPEAAPNQESNQEKVILSNPAKWWYYFTHKHE